MNFNKDNCIFCGSTLIGCADVIQKPTLRGYASTFSAAQLRNGSGYVRCGENFNIKTDCLVSGKSGTVKKKSLISISAGTGSSTREKILETSILTNDSIIHRRMEFYIYLFAANVKYYQSCYTKYISERNMTSFTKEVNVLPECSDFEEDAFQIYLRRKKMCNAKRPICNQLKDTLENLNIDLDIANNTSSDIRKKIEKKFGESLSFLSHPGKPTLVISKEYEYDIMYVSITKEHSGSKEELVCEEN
ncbi:unnamed protein product [Ceutorhynchus assimilis]|uniref:Uncharacterized protein n=1 Tax=Ceutorhynchus assimilis TaxID=467358 RepID=A0A9N9MXF0_9CUCU|nr:unnamed protein product [Ceutorhynchus assimilis]